MFCNLAGRLRLKISVTVGYQCDHRSIGYSGWSRSWTTEEESWYSVSQGQRRFSFKGAETSFGAHLTKYSVDTGPSPCAYLTWLMYI
jgi:hypothetical protein